MTRQEDIRWKQRFQNFEKSLHLLDQALALENPTIFEKAGIVQFFEVTFELSWNVMKDYLQEQGFDQIRSPRAAIKKSFEIELITEGHLWLDALNNRNLTAHTYDEKTANQIVNAIRKEYWGLLKDLHAKLKSTF
jgi:nucleotidyltransferase substrate binding protein (TIGR01987 family)